MAIPKKRKKLAEPAENSSKPVRVQSKKTGRKPEKPGALKTSSRKIDGAFDIMSHIDDADETVAETGKRSPSKPGSDRMGFRFHVSLDALMPNKARRVSETRQQPVKESHVIDIDLTIPFLWDIPIIGDITQKIFKNFKTIKF